MTHTVMTSKMNSLGNNNYSSYSKSVVKLYQVEIQDFDGEVFYYEVEASNEDEANDRASEMFGGDIYMMNIYEF